MNACANHARRAVEHEFTIAGIGRQGTAAMQEGRQAAHAIATLLHLAAIGIENAVVSLGAGAAWRLRLVVLLWLVLAVLIATERAARQGV